MGVVVRGSSPYFRIPPKEGIVSRVSKGTLFLKSQSTFLLYGVVFWLPVILAIYIGILLFTNADSIGKSILGVAIPDKYLFLGIGAILCILIVLSLRMVLKLTKLGKVLSKVPLIGLFFGQGEIMTINRLSHMQPLFVPVFADMHVVRLDTGGGKGQTAT